MDRLAALYRPTSSRTAALLLVAVNLVPLAGVLFWDWSVHTLLILYWVENGIVGVLAVARMLAATGTRSEAALGTLRAGPSGPMTKAALIPFFIMHYGIFWTVHGAFVLVLPDFLEMRPSGIGGAAGPAGDDLLMWDGIVLAALALALSHGASFVLNYLGRGEYRRTSAAAQMAAPYGRVVILHLTILLGAVVSMALGSPIGAVAVLVAVKTVIDLGFHLAEHRKAAKSAPLPEPLPAG